MTVPALNVPGSGSDRAQSATRATADGDDYIVNGSRSDNPCADLDETCGPKMPSLGFADRVYTGLKRNSP